MFSRSYSVLISSFQPNALRLPRPAAMNSQRIESAAHQAMEYGMEDMRLSERLRSPAAYHILQQSRRSALEALLSVSPTPERIVQAVDLIAAICEESTWSANTAGTHFDDESKPPIDLQCAETAVLFGWTRRVLGKRLGEVSPRIVNRMVCEVRRRFFKPALAHSDYAFLSGKGAFPMVIAVDLLLSCLLLESDDTRVGQMLKPVLRTLDECCGQHGRGLRPLAETVTEISAMADLVLLLQDMTHNALDLTGTYPTDDWLDEVFFHWIDGQLFNDPAGNGLTPLLSGNDIFRIGYIGGDEPLMALGAKVWHANHRASFTVTGRLMELSTGAALEAALGKLPHLRYASTRNNQLMSARIPGLYCSMHVGGDRANAGDVVLLADNSQVLADGGRMCPFRSLPTLGGYTQTPAPSKPCIAEFEAREDREIMSVDLTSAYPAASRLHSYQRTLITLRGESTVRIVDALAFDEPSSVVFSFVTAANATILSTAIRIGAVRMTWEGSFHIDAVPLENGLTQLRFTATQPVQQEIFSFSFERP